MQLCEQRVRERAYFIWEGEGRGFGRAEAHWLQAEAELRQATPAAVEVQVEAASAKVAKAAKPRAPRAKTAAATAVAAAPKAPAEALTGVAKAARSAAKPAAKAAKAAPKAPSRAKPRAAAEAAALH